MTPKLCSEAEYKAVIDHDVVKICSACADQELPILVPKGQKSRTSHYRIPDWNAQDR